MAELTADQHLERSSECLAEADSLIEDQVGSPLLTDHHRISSSAFVVNEASNAVAGLLGVSRPPKLAPNSSRSWPTASTSRRRAARAMRMSPNSASGDLENYHWHAGELNACRLHGRCPIDSNRRHRHRESPVAPGCGARFNPLPLRWGLFIRWFTPDVPPNSLGCRTALPSALRRAARH